MYLSKQLLGIIGIFNTIIQYSFRMGVLALVYFPMSFLLSGAIHNAMDYADNHTGDINEIAFGLLDFVCDITLISSGAIIFGLTLNYWIHAVQTLCRKVEKRVFIIRGVPGIGKKYYAEWRELNKEHEGMFTICCWTKLFEKWSENGLRYEYDPQRVREADSRLMRTYVSALSNQVDRIYVVHTFEKMWQYNPYIDLARLHGYEVEIVELHCQNKRELVHFNHRSQHNIPMKRSMRVFLGWNNDKRAIVQEPYMETSIAENGDSVPLYFDNEEERRNYAATLDRELDDYFEFGTRFEMDGEREIIRPIGKRRTSRDVIERLTGEDRWSVRNRYKYV